MNECMHTYECYVSTITFAYLCMYVCMYVKICVPKIGLLHVADSTHARCHQYPVYLPQTYAHTIHV